MIDSLTLFDWLVLVVLAMSLVLGLLRGLVKETLSLANWALAFYVANHYGTELTVHLDWAEALSPAMKALVGCGAAFFLTLLVGAILTALLGRIVSAAGLGFADRGLGGLFGVARGVLIVLIVVTAAGFTSLPTKTFWRESKFAPHAVDAVRMLKPHLPPSVAQWVRY